MRTLVKEQFKEITEQMIPNMNFRRWNRAHEGFVILVDKSLAGSTKISLLLVQQRKKCSAQVCDIQYCGRAKTTEQMKWKAFLI